VSQQGFQTTWWENQAAELEAAMGPAAADVAASQAASKMFIQEHGAEVLDGHTEGSGPGGGGPGTQFD
jgi:hypothetical protein